jgi:predicted transcriptional regulator
VSNHSNIQICLDLLSILSKSGLFRLTQIILDSKITLSSLEDPLHFLIEQGLVKRVMMRSKGPFFCITKQGSIILKTFNEYKK